MNRGMPGIPACIAVNYDDTLTNICAWITLKKIIRLPLGRRQTRQHRATLRNFSLTSPSLIDHDSGRLCLCVEAPSFTFHVMRTTNRFTNLMDLPHHRSAAWVGMVLLVLPAMVQAQFNTMVDYDGTIIITGYTGPGGAVKIPDTIGGRPVTSIGNGAFYNGAGNLDRKSNV